MTQEEKQLLLKDLCARLPYGILCHINDDDTNSPRKLSRIEVDELDGILLDFWTDKEDHLPIQVYLSEVKPYLRPMSSMTEEEKEEYDSIQCDFGIVRVDRVDEIVEFLLSHHFDYRGLIKRGLALEAPKGMYN